MRLYLAVEEFDSFNHGSYETVLGVYSTEAAAIEGLKQGSWFEGARPCVGYWLHVYGEDSIYYRVEEVSLDKPRRSHD